VAGAWIEGIYLAVNTARETKNEAIAKEIYKQEESLKYLVQLLEQSKISSEAGYVLSDLKKIQPLFGSEAKTLASLVVLEKASAELRNKVISGN
jgi:hypothetical protein